MDFGFRERIVLDRLPAGQTPKCISIHPRYISWSGLSAKGAKLGLFPLSAEILCRALHTGFREEVPSEVEWIKGSGLLLSPVLHETLKEC